MPVQEAPLQQMQAQVDALRSLVQSQQQQIHALQALEQEQPLVGFTTDSSWGMALEGLVLGAAALALGATFWWGLRVYRGEAAPSHDTGAMPEFSDSMLYLADHEEARVAPVAVSAQLHDPQQDAHGATLAHDEDDAELDYYRMALHQQGLSVTAGAGQVDSARMPLSPPPVEDQDASPLNVFSPSLSAAEFDQRAATEEVERVRRSLAQRRADRAKAQNVAPLAVARASMPEVLDIDLDQPLESSAPVALPTDGVPSASVAWDDLVPASHVERYMGDLQAPVAASATTPAPELAEHGLDLLEHAPLSEGASLLAAFADSNPAYPADTPSAPQDLPLTPMAAVEDAPMLEWNLPSKSTSVEDIPVPEANTVPVEQDTEPMLPRADVQMQLAIEFRGLGLWEESRARLLEILEQPDSGLHAQAHAMLEELATAVPEPVPSIDIKDLWD